MATDAKELVKKAQKQAIKQGVRVVSHDPTRPWREDFRKFLFLVWKHLGYGPPSKLQYDVARYIQNSPDNAMLMGFRGMAKSYISVAYALWWVDRDPDAKVLVTSASEKKAADFTKFALDLIKGMEVLRHLIPRREQRQSSLSFDVAPARAAKDPTITSYGITGQITGSRADLIISDDVEVKKNSYSPQLRERIEENIKEYWSIVKPGGKVLFLGTPQTISSIYNSFPSKGIDVRIYPARVPTEEQARGYGAKLAPFVRAMMKKVPAGSSTEPERFTDEDLTRREMTFGASEFQLQFMLNTTLSDENRFPLKLRDLIVMSLDAEQGPEVVAWGADPKLIDKDLPVLGLSGADRYHRPMFTGERFAPWSKVIMWVDPSGRGSDETAYAVVAELHGRVFVLDVGGYLDGFGPATLQAIADACVRWGVHELHQESNYGGGMFVSLLKPVVAKAWAKANATRGPTRKGGTTIVDAKASTGQKELRIINVLEPMLAQHRMVWDADMIRADAAVAEGREDEDSVAYSLAYQLSHVTHARNALNHDDRLEAVAEAVRVLVPQVSVDPGELAAQAEESRELEELLGDMPSEGPAGRGGGLGRRGGGYA